MLRNIKDKQDFNRKDSELKKDTFSSGLYLDFYNLKKSPFTITPDPEFLYSSFTHRTAIENILYGIEARMGFILLIGEVGTGKTTLCRAILDKLEGRAETVYIINPSLSDVEIIQAILDDLGIDYPEGASKKILLDHLNLFLLEVTTDKPVVIIIDDAQTMTPEGLENLRLLSNLETDKKKLLQLVLIGQQELQELLSRPELRQLKQRITISCQLDLIDHSELKQYISLRLFVAGDNGQVNFSEGAIKEIYKASGGIPRLINIICDYTLTAGYISNSPVINKKHARRAINELRDQSLVDKTFLSKIFSHISEKRGWLALLVLFTGLLYIALAYRGKIFNEEPQSIGIQAKSEVIHTADSFESNHVDTENNAGVTPKEKNREDSSVIKDDLNALENEINSSVEASKNYIVQISSLKNLKMTILEGMSLRQRGFDVHWNAVHLIEKGTWYRIYQGGFSTKKEAIAFKKEKGVSNGIIIHAPWTIVIITGEQAETPEEMYSVLQEKGIDCIFEKNGDTDYRVTSGAFMNQERAQKAAQEILDMGFDAKPMLR